MRADRLALLLDAALLACCWAGLYLANVTLLLAAGLLFLVLLAVPFVAMTGRATPGLVAIAGLLLLVSAGVLLPFALRAAGRRFELSEGQLPALALLSASVGVAGLVWVALWHAVTLQPAPWKPTVFGLCLFFFLLPASVFVLVAGIRDAPLPLFPPLVVGLSVSAVAAAAALPFVDTAFRATPGAGQPSREGAIWKRL